ncbi:hypothetical protein [Paracoccus sp. PAMC 22219]|uniref:hypothetical protein n=1 Tax=Paracoccus sp. PAMC 22219 TaxID=1569209 RepID=UPI0005A6C9BF|nr:hypothetical protein [Paracoccus sp. PAMC 22219]
MAFRRDPQKRDLRRRHVRFAVEPGQDSHPGNEAGLVSGLRPPDALNVGAAFGRLPEDLRTQRQTMAWLRALRSNTL